eukprot:gene32542-40153_t
MAGAIKTCVYQKVLRLSTASRVEYTAGNITNIYTVDIERVVGVIVALHNFWALPLQIFVAMWLLFDVVSYAMFGGLGAILTILLVNNYIAQMQKAANDHMMVHKDARMKASSEAFGSILTIKLNCWEERFMNSIRACRTEELRYIWQNLLIAAVNICLLWMAPCIVSVCTIVLYAKVLHQDVTAAKIFTALTLFRMLQDPLRALPGFITQAYQAQTSLERLHAFYMLSEQEKTESISPEARQKGHPASNMKAVLSDGEVIFENIMFAWQEQSQAVSQESVPVKSKPAQESRMDDKHLFVIENDEDEDEEEGHQDSVLSESSDKHKKSTSILKVITSGVSDLLGRASQPANKQYDSLSDGDTEQSELVDSSSKLSDAQNSSALQVDSLHILPGQFAVVRGSIGSGKSSLCSAMLHEMYSASIQQVGEGESGTGHSVHRLQGSVSYVSQQAWIQNLTVRDNILFGSPFSHEKYVRVLDACCLVQDLQEFPLGDRTEIGEKGINLSGGQKARIALARAVYADADIIILDDILAALDSIVARKVFERCVVGLLGGKTRILSTHNEEVLAHSAVNLTVTLESGEASECRDCSTGWKGRPIVSICDIDYRFSDDIGAWQCIGGGVGESTTITSGDTAQNANIAPNSMSSKSEVKGTGSFKSSVYLGYFRAMGGMHILFILAVIQTVWQCLLVGSDLYLTFWTKQNDEEQKHNLVANLAIYSSLALGSGVLVFARTFTVSFTGYRAAKVMHEGMLHSLMHAPMAWHDNNPSGRILNRL